MKVSAANSATHADDPAAAGSAGALFAIGALGTVVAIVAAAVIGAFVDWGA